jgi:hypothetical protein
MRDCDLKRRERQTGAMLRGGRGSYSNEQNGKELITFCQLYCLITSSFLTICAP